jgi:hypothetical protein
VVSFANDVGLKSSLLSKRHELASDPSVQHREPVSQSVNGSVQGFAKLATPIKPAKAVRFMIASIRCMTSPGKESPARDGASRADVTEADTPVLDPIRSRMRRSQWAAQDSIRPTAGRRRSVPKIHVSVSPLRRQESSVSIARVGLQGAANSPSNSDGPSSSLSPRGRCPVPAAERFAASCRSEKTTRFGALVLIWTSDNSTAVRHLRSGHFGGE